MISSLIKALYAGLSLWQSKESRKYQDQLIRVEREFYIEDNKELSDDATLDSIRFQLCNLSVAFSAEVTASNAKNK